MLSGSQDSVEVEFGVGESVSLKSFVSCILFLSFFPFSLLDGMSEEGCRRSKCIPSGDTPPTDSHIGLEAAYAN